MKTLETNDWIILNTIIYKVYTMEDFDDLLRSQPAANNASYWAYIPSLIFHFHTRLITDNIRLPINQRFPAEHNPSAVIQFLIFFR